MSRPSLFGFKRLLPHRNDDSPNASSHSGWYPPALRWWSLTIAVLSCWTFIGVLQYYHIRSQHDGGVLFAPSINQLPLHRLFAYRYLPTIIAVLFSIFIVWIDNDARRFEPYRQMSAPAGALAKDSVLLHYPFDFMPFVPFASFRRRHWMVFWASTATLVTTFGVIPLQAGIFTTEKITRISEQRFLMTQDFVPSHLQNSSSIVSIAHSVYGITNLNETLPEFMTQDRAFTPFTKSGASTTSNTAETWLANTTSFGMNLECRDIQPTIVTMYPNNTLCQGAYYKVGYDVTDDCTIRRSSCQSDEGTGVQKPFVSYFFSQFADNAKYQNGCDLSNFTFLATFARNKQTPNDPPSHSPAIACTGLYHSSWAKIRVDAKTRTRIDVIDRGPMVSLDKERFNTTVFEKTLTAAFGNQFDRSDRMPGLKMPPYLVQLRNTELTPVTEEGDFPYDVHPMTALALTNSNRSMEDFLASQTLAEAYESAYRLLFARAMVDTMRFKPTSATIADYGTRQEQLEAVVLVPVFVYCVEALLAVVSLSIGVLLYFALSRTRSHDLVDDPGSTAAIMSMTADSKELLRTFETLDCCSAKALSISLAKRRFHLSSMSTEVRIEEVTLRPSSPTSTTPPNGSKLDDKKANHSIGDPVRPLEFRLFTGLPLISLFIALAIMLAVFFAKARGQGLPLPSTDRVVRNLLTAYLPTAIATLIEPVWVLLNRLLCVLQPLEELRTTRARASRSLTLNYTSLPPQLVAFRAVRARHVFLAVVCAMSLLSNLLATAFAGLFILKSTTVAHRIELAPYLNARFVMINGSVAPTNLGGEHDISVKPEGPFTGAYQGTLGDEPFLMSESNQTRNTTLPAWTDGNAMYIPFRTSESHGQMAEFQSQTRYFGATPNCRPLVFESDYKLMLWRGAPQADILDPSQSDIISGDRSPNFEVTVRGENEAKTTCYAKHSAVDVGTPTDSFSAGISYGNNFGRNSRSQGYCLATGNVAGELLMTLRAAWNASMTERDICMGAVVLGWMRTKQKPCRKGAIDRDRADFEDSRANNTFMMLCQPRFSSGLARIRVDGAGVLLAKPTDVTPDADSSSTALMNYTTNGIPDLMGQANAFLFRSLFPTWHNDSYASEYIHYFINREVGDLRLTDPLSPLPSFEDVEQAINKAYARLFAFWLSVNRGALFEPATETTARLQGIGITEEERLFFTVPMFIISEIILGIYVVVSILMYVRRPGRYLARMPISIAAVVGLFASSTVLKDLQDTSQMTNKERERHLNDLDDCYGYGSYIGNDGAVHVGIEKVPYVRYMKEFTFEGSRTVRELTKGRAHESEAASGSETTGSRTTHDAAEPSQDGQVCSGTTLLARTSVIDTQPPPAEYLPLDTLDLADRVAIGSSTGRLSALSSASEWSPANQQPLVIHDDADEQCVSPLEEVAFMCSEELQPPLMK